VATLREYFDADFGNAARVYVKPRWGGANAEAAVLYDFSANIAFIACYVAGNQNDSDYFWRLIESFRPGTPLEPTSQIKLPSASTFPGQLEIKNTSPLTFRARFFANPEWISIDRMNSSGRVFVYSESSLDDSQILALQAKGQEIGLRIQFRGKGHATERSKQERPLAFISHDSRDKGVARQIAVELQRSLCPVWYDEFSLRVGANLRDSIEAGLKECRRCILILSPNFFSNGGWTKKEFDSVFSREILERRQILLPIWLGVSKEAVFEYSPSLLNVKGLDWGRGCEAVCRELCDVILDR